MLNRGEIRTRDLGVTSPHALPSELHCQPDFKIIIYSLKIRADPVAQKAERVG